MSEATHPTSERLLATVSQMLDSQNPHDIVIDEVLSVSGVSRGSLYYFFGDFQGLIRATLLRRFVSNVEADARAMLAVSEESTTKDEYWHKIRRLSALTQIPERAPIRAERSRIISLSSTDASFAASLGQAQDEATNKMADAIALAQEKGWVTSALTPQAIAVFLQAYSLGRAVDDIAINKVPNEQWQEVIERVISSLQS